MRDFSGEVDLRCFESKPQRDSTESQYNPARCFLSALSLCSLLFAAGCGGEPPPPTGTVSGSIEFKKPTASQLDLMIVDPSSGKAASTPIESDGAFSFGSPMLTGEYIAYLAPRSDPNATEAVAVKIDKTIPENYWNEINSPLRVEIKEGANTATLTVQ